MRPAAVAVFAAAAVVAACVVLAVQSVAPVRADANRSRTHVIEIRQVAYAAPAAEVQPGDTVRWINHDPVPHTATARDSTWDSGRIEAGGEWSLVVEGSTTRAYFCVYHPTMTASLAPPVP